jgi:hypothetical protein
VGAEQYTSEQPLQRARIGEDPGQFRVVDNSGSQGVFTPRAARGTGPITEDLARAGSRRRGGAAARRRWKADDGPGQAADAETPGHATPGGPQDGDGRPPRGRA